MWVHSIEAIPTGAGSLITAVIDWEDNPSRAPFHLRFETEQIEHPQLETPGNALLAACFPLARHHGERRIRMEADVCPLLAEGLLTAHAWWNKWSGEHTAPPEIEAGGANAEREQPRAAAALLSGGVDSLHMLYRNRLLFATDSPVRIGQAILVHGFDMGRRIEDPQEDLFAAARSRLQSVVRSIGVELGVCRTNLRQIPTATGFWLERYYGVAAIAAGHAAIAGPACLFIAATYDVANLSPLGSHPAVDTQLSSQQLTIVHDGSRFSRLDKVRELINWPEATDNLRVCARPGRHEYNCGRCEKCLRTRLELLVSGCESSAAFGETRFDPDFLEGIEIGNDYQAACYADILDALDKSAHRSLGERIAAMLSAYLELAAQENRRRKGLGANFA